MSDKFVITKDILQGFCAEGKTVETMAEAITSLSGAKCTPNTIRAACKHHGIDLRKKRKPSPFVFDSIASNTTEDSVRKEELKNKSMTF